MTHEVCTENAVLWYIEADFEVTGLQIMRPRMSWSAPTPR